MAQIGDKVKDVATGFTGIVFAKTTYLYGCKHVLVQPSEIRDGKIVDSVWMDEGRVEVVEAGAIPVPASAETREGCCKPAPKQPR